MRRIFLALALAFCIPMASWAQIPSKADQKTVTDTLSARLFRRDSVKSKFSLRKVIQRGDRLDLYFTASLGDHPWTLQDQKWFLGELEKEWKSKGGGQIGKIICNGLDFEELICPELDNGGAPKSYRLTEPAKDRRTREGRFIRRDGARFFAGGMSDRYIALWQSHGRYFNMNDSLWSWQRATMHRTVEDMYTQSYVLPFLIPMLENAGAYVMTPRERDIQWREIITDNDPAFSGPRSGRMRKSGHYSEEGSWNDAGEGFADAKAAYSIDDNPFTMGSAKKAYCNGEDSNASVRWTPDIEERGEYAVYISYKSLPESTKSAHYTIRHMGGETEFHVNQRIGGGTWIYLGTFEFAEGSKGYVMLDNSGKEGAVVTADAVKIGGGMGKVERAGMTSDVPSYMEGALYWMRWAGTDTSVTHQWDNDYTRDYASRGAWTSMMKSEKGVPFDLSLAFHTDAGITPDDSIVGTLAIYTLLCDKERKYEDGRDRILARTYAKYVQDQVVNDIRSDFEPGWSRRKLWDKSYSECRTTGVPGMILELLSHQNFADMKYGLDPSFRFTVCRAVYKGMLKTLSEFYGCRYTVQPLPVNSFSAVMAGDSVRLSWCSTEDRKEPTAVPSGYVVYTRTDDGVFDKGREVTGSSISMAVTPGHIYSFKVAAFNDGGYSFPSEILSVGKPAGVSKGTVLIVNNFDRISAPHWIDGQEYAGFYGHFDSGVPYIREINYIGENYEFRRSAEYVDDFNPGFGASYSDQAGEVIAGNTFDFPYVHGYSLLALGYEFCSMSRDAFTKDTPLSSDERPLILDLLCGKQKTTKTGSGAKPDRYKVFPSPLMAAVRRFTESGGNVIISGSDIASDASGDFEATRFIEDVLGYKYINSYGTSSGTVGGMAFSSRINSEIYCVECPDALGPSDKHGKVLLRYPGTNTPAAVLFRGEGYKSVSIGVPLETFISEPDRRSVFKTFLQELQKR